MYHNPRFRLTSRTSRKVGRVSVHEASHAVAAVLTGAGVLEANLDGPASFVTLRAPHSRATLPTLAAGVAGERTFFPSDEPGNGSGYGDCGGALDEPHSDRGVCMAILGSERNQLDKIARYVSPFMRSEPVREATQDLAQRLEKRISMTGDEVEDYVKRSMGQRPYYICKAKGEGLVSSVDEWLEGTKPAWGKKTIAFAGRIRLMPCVVCGELCGHDNRFALFAAQDRPLCDKCAHEHDPLKHALVLRKRLLG